MTKVLAVISFIDRDGNPVDPGFGRPEGGHPDHDLPGHGHADHDLPGGGHVSNRPPGSRPVRPDNSLPWAPVGMWPPDETDPEWGVGAPKPPHPGYIPIDPSKPVDPSRPDQGLPPVQAHPAPPIASTPPGTIWPPLPGNPPTGKAALVVWLIGIGWRYVVVDIPPTEAQPK